MYQCVYMCMVTEGYSPNLTRGITGFKYMTSITLRFWWGGVGSGLNKRLVKNGAYKPLKVGRVVYDFPLPVIYR